MVSGQWSIINYEWMNYAAKRNNATISRRRNHSPFTIDHLPLKSAAKQ